MASSEADAATDSRRLAARLTANWLSERGIHNSLMVLNTFHMLDRSLRRHVELVEALLCQEVRSTRFAPSLS